MSKYLKEFAVEADGKTHALAIRRPTQADLDQAEAAAERAREAAIREGLPSREQANRDALSRLSADDVKYSTGLGLTLCLGEEILADPASAADSKRVMAECMVRWRDELRLLMADAAESLLESVEGRWTVANFEQLVVLTTVKRHNGRRVYSSRADYARNPGPLRDAIVENVKVALCNRRMYPEETYLQGLGVDPSTVLNTLSGPSETPVPAGEDQKVESTGFVDDLTETEVETPNSECSVRPTAPGRG